MYDVALCVCEYQNGVLSIFNLPLTLNTQALSSLDGVQSLYVGKPGAHGRGKGRSGARAEPTMIPLPLGTLIMHEGQVIQ